MRVWMIGTSMLGKRVIGSCMKLDQPTTIRIRKPITDGTGLRIDQADTFMLMA